MNNNTDKKNGRLTTNILLACILAVVLAVAVFVVKTEIGRMGTKAESSTEESSITIGESKEGSEEESEDSEKEEKTESSVEDDSEESEEDEETEESEETDESEESKESEESSKTEEADKKSDKDKTEKVKKISLKEFTKNNASLPFEKDDDDLIIAFDTDDTLLVPSSDEEIEGAIEAINHLEDNGYHWCIISANADDDKPTRIKENILDLLDSTDHYLGFYIVNPGRDRYIWCNENKVDVLVDDNQDTAKLAEDYLFQTLLVDASGVDETKYVHPMKGSSPYNGFRSYLRSIKMLKNL